MRADFSFSTVGQGCFYIGNIISGRSKKELVFVYDCGSKSSHNHLNESIVGFKHKFKKIDALVLSHLDEDHVNGINQLLVDITCEYVFLPYLTPMERLYVAMNSYDKYSYEAEQYFLFIASPHSYLIDKGVKRVIYISGNSESNLEGNPEFQKEPADADNKFDMSNMQSAGTNEIPEVISATAVTVKKGNSRIFFDLEWEFYFYNQKPIQPKKTALLIKKIKEIYDINVESQLTTEQLQELLNDKVKLKALRKVWKSLYNSTNSSGLVVMHKPLNYDCGFFSPSLLWGSFDSRYYSPYWRSRNFKEVNQNKNQDITLLTGDIFANQIQESKYISDHLGNINVLQIPHHGSGTGWDATFLKELRYDTILVVNFGYGNHYGHPSAPVMQELMYREGLCFCNQFEALYYTFVTSN